jgi:large subunit ribosomal protein L25
MQTVEIIGYQRANLGKKASADIRAEGNVPCVLYGGKDQVHFYSPMILFRELLYSPNVYQVNLNIEGVEYKAILQEAQFHPVNEMILHVDFLEFNENKPTRMEVPIRFTGTAVGVTKGGKLVQKLRRLTVKAFPQNMPDFIEVDVTELDLAKNIRVSDVIAKDYQILNNPTTPLASVEVPRALRGKEGA